MNKGYVYLLSSVRNGKLVYKLGKTKRNIKSRLKEHYTGNPNDIEVMGVYKTSNYHELESTLKRINKIYLIRGEWFSDIFYKDNWIKYCQEVDKQLNIIKKQN